MFYSCTRCSFIVDISALLFPTPFVTRLTPNISSSFSRRKTWRSTTTHGVCVVLVVAMYDANVDHPSEFYCQGCEKQMNPKMWMYHCRGCDVSFHHKCLPAVSGDCRNIKFGQQYLMSAAHPHPLSYQLLTTKRRCDVCPSYVYNQRGFQCASYNFFMCLSVCGWRFLRERHIQVADS